MMAKNAQARMDKADLTPLRAWAERIVKADDILARTIALENGIEAMEARRTQLQRETADLLATSERTKQAHDAAMAQQRAELDALTRQRGAEQAGLRQDRDARAKAADDDARAYKERQERITAELREEQARLRAENTSLRAQRADLQKDLDDTLSRYTAARR